MQVDLTRQLFNVNNESYMEGDKILTVGQLLKTASFGATDAKDNSAEKCFDLYLKLRKAENTIDLAPEEIVTLKECIKKSFSQAPAGLVGQLFYALDGKEIS